MKKLIVILGTILLFFISIATLFKLMHWPGSGPMLVVTITLFCMPYLPLFFIQRILENKKGLNVAVNLLALVSTEMIFNGVEFKLMHWPGAGPMLVLGTLIFIFPTLILYVIQQFKEYDRKFSEFGRMLFLTVFICIFLIFWAAQPSKSIVWSYLKVEDATLETNKNLKEYNAFLLKQIEEKKDSTSVNAGVAKKIHEQSLLLVDYIENIKIMIINRIEQDPSAIKDHWFINSPDEIEGSTFFLGSGSEMGTELLSNLVSYNQEIKNQLAKLSIDKQILENQQGFGVQTELNPRMTEMNEMSWNGGMFDHQVIVGTLALLSSTQNDVLNAEFNCLKLISINEGK